VAAQLRGRLGWGAMLQTTTLILTQWEIWPQRPNKDSLDNSHIVHIIFLHILNVNLIPYYAVQIAQRSSLTVTDHGHISPSISVGIHLNHLWISTGELAEKFRFVDLTKTTRTGQ